MRLVLASSARAARLRTVAPASSVARNAAGKRRLLSVDAPKSAGGSSAPPPPPPPPADASSSSSAAGWLLVAAAAAGGAYYFQDDIKKALSGSTPSSNSSPATKAVAVVAEKAAVASTPQSASVSAPVKPAASPAPAEPKKEVLPSKQEVEALAKRVTDAEAGKKPQVDWKLVRSRVVDLLDDDAWDDGSWGPIFVRLAWHAGGSYDKNTGRGGSEYAYMRFPPEAKWFGNRGLEHARARLEPLKKEFPTISFADLWSFAGSVAIEEMGGPKINWRPGRKDAVATPEPPLPDGLLPDADGRDKKSNPADHLRDIFYRMGFNDQEIVALSGAHALGRCHQDRLGYEGPWTNAPTTFSNEFFRLLLEEGWEPKKMLGEKPWTGPLQYEDKTSKQLMMLPTDMALVQDPKMRKYVELYAKDEQKFFKDFAAAWLKLQENGVRAFHGTRKYYIFGPRE